MFKEIIILLCIVAAAWTQTCTYPPASMTQGTLQYTYEAQSSVVWSGPVSSVTSSNRNCVAIPNGALAVRSNSVFYECRLFSNSICTTSHSSFYADYDGWRNTGTRVMGVQCPWSCSSFDAPANDVPAEN